MKDTGCCALDHRPERGGLLVGTKCSPTPGSCFSDSELSLRFKFCSLPVIWLQLSCSHISGSCLSVPVILFLTCLCFVFLTFPASPEII